MKRKHVFRLGVGVLGVGVLIAGLGVGDFIDGHPAHGREAEIEQPQAPHDVSSDDVPTVSSDDASTVALDAATQKRVDIAVAIAQLGARHDETSALATVLPLQELGEARNAYVAAKARAERSQAMMEAARREFDRVGALHGDGRNVSDKLMDSTQAVWRGDEAEANADREALATVARTANLKWGPVLAAQVETDGMLFRDLLDRRQVLLRVAASAASSVIHPPAKIRIDADDGVARDAAWLSLCPQTDPRIQGFSFFYVAPADGLLIGATLTAHLAEGGERRGASIPAEAVVWWQGKAWFYIQSAPDRFERREMVDAQPVGAEWFVPGLTAVPVVVRGAQLMLSEELRAQIRVGDDE